MQQNKETKTLYPPFQMIGRAGSAEITEKKSRFIATLSTVLTEEEAVLFIEMIKKRYWDARHNCYAFVIGTKAQITRCSDDGEPAGTAGKPILEVLMGEEIRNTAVVVTRYFGGTLLGTGGLIRAYTQAARAGISASEIITMRYGTELLVETDYNGIGRLLYLTDKMGINKEEPEYTDIVRMKMCVPNEWDAKLRMEITEATAGKAVIKEIGKKYYADS